MSTIIDWIKFVRFFSDLLDESYYNGIVYTKHTLRVPWNLAVPLTTAFMPLNVIILIVLWINKRQDIIDLMKDDMYRVLEEEGEI